MKTESKNKSENRKRINEVLVSEVNKVLMDNLTTPIMESETYTKKLGMILDVVDVNKENGFAGFRPNPYQF